MLISVGLGLVVGLILALTGAGILQGPGRVDDRLGETAQRRLANRSRDDFRKLMSELHLPKPKLIDVAVPANQNLGLPHGA